MINERALLSALKGEWKLGGYLVGRTEKRLVLSGSNWTLECTMQNLPRKVLALLVEHLGQIPEAGDCWNVSKRAGVQGAILPMKLDTEGGRPAAPTQLTFGGWRVWQEKDTLRILLMDPDLTDIVVLREEGEAMSFGDGIQKDGGQDVLEVISQGMPVEAKYLEGVGWNER